VTLAFGKLDAESQVAAAQSALAQLETSIDAHRLINKAVQAMSAGSGELRELEIITGQTDPDGIVVAVRDRGRGWMPQIPSAFSRTFKRPSLAVWGWAYRSAVRSSRLTVLLKKSLSTADQNFSRPLMRFSDKNVRDLVS
jgi:hypothetical protein